MSSEQRPILEIKKVRKTFGHTVALNGVNFELLPGEVHALAGENGAGKSTLMKLIDGIYQPDLGDIVFDGQAVTVQGPLDAQRLGVHFVHQEIALCNDISVAENIVMAKTNASKRFFVNFRKMQEEAAVAIQQLADIDPKSLVRDLSISNQQLVEIAKALVADCRILILDEPTAALTDNESERLFAIMRKLKAKGIAIIYISHRMAEIFNECDRVTVFRDGQYVTTQDVSATTPEQVVNYMVGRDITELYPPKFAGQVRDNPTLLSVKGLSDKGHVCQVSFDVHEQEIFGISGLIGAGRTELVKAICGLQAKSEGRIQFLGKDVSIRSYQDGIQHGIAYLSEDRKGDGVFLALSIAQNISAIAPEQVSRYGLIDRERERQQASQLTEQLNLKAASLDALVSSLSGGNQQKVAIAKMLSIRPKLIILDEPTRGIDVGAKSEIHKMIRSLAASGVGVIVISSELPEIIGLSDRVMVMCEGRNAGVLESDMITEENIMLLASGAGKTDLTRMAS